MDSGAREGFKTCEQNLSCGLSCRPEQARTSQIEEKGWVCLSEMTEISFLTLGVCVCVCV